MMPRPALISKLLLSALLSVMVLMLLPGSCLSASSQPSGASTEAEEERLAEEALAVEEREEAIARAASTQTSQSGGELTLSASAAFVQFGQSANIGGLVLYQTGTRYLTIFLVPPQVGSCPTDPVAPSGADPLLDTEAVDNQTPVSDISDPLERAGEWQLCGYLGASASEATPQVMARTQQPIMVGASGSSQSTAWAMGEMAAGSSSASAHVWARGVCRKGRHHKKKARGCRKPRRAHAATKHRHQPRTHA